MNREKLRRLLFEKGLPTEIVDIIKIGRANNYLRIGINTEYTELINNNHGVCQGSPLSAFLFIIYNIYLSCNDTLQ